MKSFDLLINKPFDELQEKDFELQRLFSYGSYEELKDFCDKEGITEIYRQDYLIQYLIFIHTLKNSDKEFEQLKEHILKYYSDDIKNIEVRFNEKYNTHELYIDTIDGEVKALILSEVITSFKEKFPYIDTDERNCECFERSFDISKTLGLKNELVTAYQYGNSNKARFLHSFIETKLNGDDVVIDFTMNAIINKTGYYNIKHIHEDEILERISNETINEDLLKYEEMMDLVRLSITEYNIFRNEIIKDFEKNDFLRK